MKASSSNAFCIKADKLEFSGRIPITKVRLAVEWRRECPKCGGTQLLELRQTHDGCVRDQPYCSKCRSRQQPKESTPQ